MLAYLLTLILFAQAAADAPAQPAASPPAAEASAQPADPSKSAATSGAEKGDAQPDASGAKPAQGPAISDMTRFVLMLAVTGALFYFIMLRPQRRKEQELRDRINNVKENERVVTIGGIHGVVTNVRRDVQRVTIRVDETTGTKLQMNMSAIARVVTGEDDNSAAGGTKS